MDLRDLLRRTFARGLFAPALKGLSFRERNRVLRLARSGGQIEEESDASRVEAIIRWEIHADNMPVVLFQAILGVVALALLAWLWYALGRPWSFGTAVGPIAVTTWLETWRRRRLRATAAANGWEM